MLSDARERLLRQPAQGTFSNVRLFIPNSRILFSHRRVLVGVAVQVAIQRVGVTAHAFEL